MTNFSLAKFFTQNTVGVGVFGAVVGGAAAAAKTYAEQKKSGRHSRQEVIETAGQEAAGMGVASAASVVVAGAIGGGMILSLGTMLITASATKYVWDRGLDAVQRGARRSRAAGKPRVVVKRRKSTVAPY